MEARRITINGTQFTFICDAWDTRDGFAHGCSLHWFADGFNCERAKRFYLNRTWECWRYQSVMQDAIRKAIENEKARVAETVKLENGWKNITRTRRGTLERAYENDKRVETLNMLYSEISSYNPDWD